MGTPSATIYVDYLGTPHTFIKLDDGNGSVNYYAIVALFAATAFLIGGSEW
jgi:hypothetical protein